MGFPCVMSAYPIIWTRLPLFTVHTQVISIALSSYFLFPGRFLMMCIYCSYMHFFALSVFKNQPLLFSSPQRERHRAFSRDQQEQVYRLHPGKVSLSLQPHSGQLNSCLEMTLFMMMTSGFILTHSNTACCNLVRCAVWTLDFITFAVIQRPWLGCPDPFMRA